MMEKEQQIKLRLVRLMEQPFRVHPEESFDNPEMEVAIMAEMPAHEKFCAVREKLQTSKYAAPPELRVFYEEPLLTREQEYHLFRQFNFLKYKAKAILQTADPTEPVIGDVEKVEELLADASLIKRQLAGSNVRLVMNIAKKQKEFAKNPNIDLLAEIVSDGYIGLMRAVDYFDYRLGNKFSTYATWAILDTMKRSRVQRIKHSVCVNGLDEFMCDIPDEEVEYEEKLPIRELLKTMPSRERRVVVEYFGLETGQSRTLQEIGDEIGISKERVRQLRDAGLDRLRSLLSA